jgi:hypothetical protein
VWLEGLGKLKKSTSSGTRTGDLPACSIVPQLTTLPHAPVEDRHIEYSVIKEHVLEKFINKYVFTKLQRYLYRKVNKLYDKRIFSHFPFCIKQYRSTVNTLIIILVNTELRFSAGIFNKFSYTIYIIFDFSKMDTTARFIRNFSTDSTHTY